MHFKKITQRTKKYHQESTSYLANRTETEQLQTAFKLSLQTKAEAG